MLVSPGLFPKPGSPGTGQSGPHSGFYHHLKLREYQAQVDTHEPGPDKEPAGTGCGPRHLDDLRMPGEANSAHVALPS